MGKPTLPSENDILYAYKALSIAHGLSNTARQVAGALIDHFNRHGGRCDPSIARLCKLLELHRATVLRATKELTAKHTGLFEKNSHGGWHNTASYQPNWERFRAIVLEWKIKMQGDKSDENVAEMRPDTSQDCDVNGSKNATQTNLNNQSNNHANSITTKLPKRANEEKNCEQSKPHCINENSQHGLLKKNIKRGKQIHMLLPINGGRLSPSHGDVATMKASERIDKAMLGLGNQRYATLVTAINPECYN